MKILFTFFVPSGGVETLNRTRAKVLREHGIEAHLLYTQPGTGLQNIGDIPVYITNEDEDIRSILESQQFDAVVATSDFYMSYRMRQVGYKGTILFESQGLGTWKEAYLTLLEAEPYLRYCTQGIIMPPITHLLELFELLCPNIPRFVFPNMMDTRQFKRVDTYKLKDPIVAWVGRLEPNKNWSEFLHICHALLQAKPQLSIRMFTDETLAVPAEKQRFEDTVRELQLGNHLKCLSSVPNQEMPWHYSLVGNSGGLLLSTSRVEGFGYAIAEAMACHCPVLSTDSDGVRALVVPDVTGKFYTLGNTQQAAAIALELMDNPAQREQLCQAAYQHMLDHLSPEAYTRTFVEILRMFGIAG